MTSLTVLCPNSRRCVVKVGPGRLLREVAEEACLKQGYDVSMHELMHQKKRVDLSLPFRLSNLPNNATLELIAVEDSVPLIDEICLQLEDGERKILILDRDYSLLALLERFSIEFEKDLTSNIGSSIPSCAFMNKQYRGTSELSHTTIRTMGIRGGRCLIRYQRVEMSTEELVRVAEKVESERRRKEVLCKDFVLLKAENDARTKKEEERMKIFEEEQHEKEKREIEKKEKRKNGETEVAEGNMEVDGYSNTSEVQDGPPAEVVSNSNEWSSDRSSFTFNSSNDTSQDRLARLQNMLENVDHSLNGGQNGRIDMVMEQLATHGHVPIEQLNNQLDEFPLRNFKFPETPSVQCPSSSSFDISSQPKTMEKAERRSVIFTKQSPPVSTSSIVTKETEEDFYDLSIEDVKKAHKSLKEEVRRQDQKTLVPKSFIDSKNKKLKESAWRNSVIRFVLDDKRIVQANFYSNEPACNLYSFFSGVLYTPSIPFILNLSLNCPIINDKSKDLVDIGIAPSSTVYLRFKDTVTASESLFDQNLVDEVSQEEADLLSREWLSANTTYVPWSGTVDESRTVSNKRVADSRGSRVEDGNMRQAPPKLPKWLKK